MSHIIRLFAFTLCLLIAALPLQPAHAQSLGDRRDRIRAAIETSNLASAITELRSLHNVESSVFALNNYDYLLGHLPEQSGDLAGASSNYQSVIARKSVLSQYALWHLAQIARSTGDLVLERGCLRQLITSAPTSLLRDAATLRLARSFFESGDYAAVVSTLRRTTSKTIIHQ